MSEEGNTKALRAPLRLSIALLLIGILFKIQQWSYAKEIIVPAFALIGILYPFRYFKKINKRFLDHVKLVLVTSWSLNGIFIVLHLPFGLLFSIISSITFAVWILMEGVNYLTANETKTPFQILSNALLIASGLTIVIGALFKIMHWPFSGILLVVGLGLGAVWLLKDIFNK